MSGGVTLQIRDAVIIGLIIHVGFLYLLDYSDDVSQDRYHDALMQKFEQLDTNDDWAEMMFHLQKDVNHEVYKKLMEQEVEIEIQTGL